jgi:hypothetical protein
LVCSCAVAQPAIASNRPQPMNNKRFMDLFFKIEFLSFVKTSMPVRVSIQHSFVVDRLENESIQNYCQHTA